MFSWPFRIELLFVCQNSVYTLKWQNFFSAQFNIDLVKIDQFSYECSRYFTFYDQRRLLLRYETLPKRGYVHLARHLRRVDFYQAILEQIFQIQFNTVYLYVYKRIHMYTVVWLFGYFMTIWVLEEFRIVNMGSRVMLKVRNVGLECFWLGLRTENRVRVKVEKNTGY